MVWRSVKLQKFKWLALYNLIVIILADSTKVNHRANYSCNIFLLMPPGFFFQYCMKASKIRMRSRRRSVKGVSQKNKLEHEIFLLAIYKDRSFEETLVLIWIGTWKVRGVNSIKIYVVLPSTAVVIFEMFFGISSIITYF